jgi:hypothetical protein
MSRLEVVGCHAIVLFWVERSRGQSFFRHGWGLLLCTRTHVRTWDMDTRRCDTLEWSPLFLDRLSQLPLIRRDGKIRGVCVCCRNVKDSMHAPIPCRLSYASFVSFVFRQNLSLFSFSFLFLSLSTIQFLHPTDPFMLLK